MSFNPDLVRLQFIYERDKYLLKELVQEMGLKMAVEVTQTEVFFFFFLLGLRLLNAPSN